MRPAVFAGKPPDTRNFLRVHQQRARRNFDMAGKFRIVQLHAHVAAVRPKLFQQIAAHGGLDLHRACAEKILSLRLARTAKVPKAQRLHFLPSSMAKRFHIALDGTRHGIVCNAENSFDAPFCFIQRRAGP